MPRLPLTARIPLIAHLPLTARVPTAGLLIVLLGSLCFASPPARADAEPPGAGEASATRLAPGAEEVSPARLTVGTRHAPPFVIRRDDGGFDGLAIDLWSRIAAELGLEYDLVELDIPDLLDGLEQGDLDAVAAAITATAQRAERIDFTHPYHTTGLGIAVPVRPAGVLAALRGLLSLEIIAVLSGLAVLLLGVGLILWLAERRRNPDQFPAGARGVAEGFWWSAVTMTTVGYGDRYPVTALGRLVALVWMFAGLLLISTFTAAIASALTVSQITTTVQGPDDLYRVRVGTLVDTTSARYLEDTRVAHTTYPEALAGIQAVATGDLDAFVYDAPILQYLIRTELHGQVQVLPVIFARQDYAIGLPRESPLRARMNPVILEHVVNPAWEETLERYLGR